MLLIKASEWKYFRAKANGPRLTLVPAPEARLLVPLLIWTALSLLLSCLNDSKAMPFYPL